MTDKTKTGGPAFPALPITRELNGEMLYQAEGITIRDYFAAQAMQGICARVQWSPRGIVETAYNIADAMLEKRNA